MPQIDDTSDGALLLPPEEAARRLRISRTRMYALLGSGDVESVMVGRLRRIPAEALREYVDRLRARTRAAVPDRR